MAHDNNGQVLPFTAASALGQGVIAALLNTGSSIAETVTAAASPGWLGIPVGITKATQASWGYEVGVVVSGVAKVRAAASIGAGAFVGPASSNGAAGPVGASGVASGLVGSALQLPRFVVGKAITSAAAGEYFSCIVDPQQIF